MGALADSYSYLEKEIPSLIQNDSGPVNITAIQNDLKDDILTASIETVFEGDSEKSDSVDINVSFDRSLSLRSTISRKMSLSYNGIYESKNNQPPKFTSDVNSYPSIGLDDEEDIIAPSITMTKTQLNENDSIQVKHSSIQTFSFCSLEINVDTLVRLFIIA